MKISLNQSLSLVLIAMMGLTFSACTGVTETSTTTTAPTTTTNTQPAVNTPPAATFVTESPLPEKYRPLLKKAEQGNVKAQFAVATIFHGTGGTIVKQDFKEALKWFKKAADQGHAEAQYKVALYYSVGDQMGLTKDDHQSYVYAKKAALQGHADSQFLLGTYYNMGKGGAEKNDILGYAWINMAANKGNANAIGLRSELQACPTFSKIIPQAEAVSAALEQRIAKQQHS